MSGEVVKGMPLHIVTSEMFSREKRDHMQAFGAHLTLVPSPNGGMTKALTLEMVETARRIAAETGGYWTDQLTIACDSGMKYLSTPLYS